MSDKGYNDFVSSLKEEGVNKKEVSLTKLYLLWGAFIVLFSVLVLTIVGVRSDFPTVFYSKQFVLETLTLFWLLIITSIWAIKLTIPGRELKFNMFYTFIPFAIWNVLLFLSYIYEYSTANFLKDVRTNFGPSCFTSLFVIGLPAALILFVLVRGNRPTLLKRTSLFIFLSGMALSGLLMQFHCGNDDPLHIFTSHLLPVVIVSLVGFLAGKKILHW